jgi:hypothetical protein
MVVYKVYMTTRMGTLTRIAAGITVLTGLFMVAVPAAQANYNTSGNQTYSTNPCVCSDRFDQNCITKEWFGCASGYPQTIQYSQPVQNYNYGNSSYYTQPYSYSGYNSGNNGYWNYSNSQATNCYNGYGDGCYPSGVNPYYYDAGRYGFNTYDSYSGGYNYGYNSGYNSGYIYLY